MVTIVYKTSDEMALNTSIFHEIVEIQVTNNFIYEPTLIERYKAKNLRELRKLLYEEIVQRVQDGYHFYLAYKNGVLIAFNSHKLTTLFVKNKKRTCLQIGTTNVHSKHYNKGVGTLLYDRIECDAVNFYKVEYVKRITWSTNQHQLHLFNKKGYTVQEVEKDYYGVGNIDRYHLIKDVRKTSKGGSL